MGHWTAAPDRIGVVLAARAWRWWPHPEEEEPSLRSLMKGTRWPPGRRLEAVCIEPAYAAWIRGPRPAPRHEAPHLDCSCGIWGLASGEETIRQHASPAYVYGVVALWGAVVVGELGWRGQYAYPQALVRVEIPPRPWEPDAGAARRAGLLEALAELYEVPLLERWPELTPAPGGGGS